MKSWWPLFALLSALPLSAGGDAPGIVRMETPLQVEAAYERVYKALEQARFWVVHEVDLGERMAHQAEAWGAITARIFALALSVSWNWLPLKRRVAPLPCSLPIRPSMPLSMSLRRC